MKQATTNPGAATKEQLALPLEVIRLFREQPALLLEVIRLFQGQWEPLHFGRHLIGLRTPKAPLIGSFLSS
jgi:hypothetical protein